MDGFVSLKMARQAFAQTHTHRHDRLLIVYSSFGEVYRELLTCRKCSSFRFLCQPEEIAKGIYKPKALRSGALVVLSPARQLRRCWPHGDERPDDDSSATAIDNRQTKHSCLSPLPSPSPWTLMSSPADLSSRSATGIHRHQASSEVNK